jgi:hypothetical protein
VFRTDDGGAKVEPLELNAPLSNKPGLISRLTSPRKEEPRKLSPRGREEREEPSDKKEKEKVRSMHVRRSLGSLERSRRRKKRRKSANERRRKRRRRKEKRKRTTSQRRWRLRVRCEHA